MKILEKYNLRFIRRPFIFHNGKAVVRKQAVHDEENDCWGYFLNRYTDPDDIDAIISTIDCISNEDFYTSEYPSDIYLDSLHLEYTDTAILFQTLDGSLIQEAPLLEVKEILLLWKDFIMTTLPPQSSEANNIFTTPLITRFENHNRRPISTPEEASVYNYKIYEKNGIILKREEYDKDKLLTVFYYLQNNETEREAVETILNDYAGIDGFAVVKTEDLNDHTKETQRFFTKEGIYDEYFVTCIFDHNNCMTYERTESYFKGVLDVEIRKYYFENSIELFEFAYTINGELTLMRGSESPFVAENDGSITVSEIDLFFPGFLDQNPYYKNTEMMP